MEPTSLTASALGPMVLGVLGGLGVFLIGMLVLTDGLRALAGPTERRVIERFTKSPASGALTGAILTAVVQSSSATTLAAVGFVGAGLVTFPQALGLILGANVGTTATGWLVALFGFKLDIAAATSPLLFGGVLLRLFGKGRVSAVGSALAGFGLVFVGIQTLQGAMSGVEGRLLPESLTASGFGGRVTLVGLGALVTIVTQSSSAGVATALAALAAGTLEFPEAAALVIGMDVGTTVTAGLATVGGSVEMRRTGWAHVVFNMLSGVGGLLLLPLFVGAAQTWGGDVLAAEPELSLVAFHTSFNVLGVLLALPFAHHLARLMERLIPAGAGDGREPQRLEPRLLKEPALALRAATTRAFQLLAALARETRTLVTAPAPPGAAERHAGTDRESIASLRAFVFELAKQSPHPEDDPQIAALLHLLDHADRLAARHADRDRASRLLQNPDLAHAAREFVELSRELAEVLDSARESPQGNVRRDPGPLTQLEARLAEAYELLRASSRPTREQVLDRAARGHLGIEHAVGDLDAHRWLERVQHHLWRAAHHAVVLVS